eukprot:TRINITY_DN24209_c0_g1_i1.p1 TRINITY_DN24209_c0_g1~~TRINITY_DN24209_c0_g1_i1.p1  ORF type:complete len:256 (-),score=52.33 TRINITY_DN24209_c0_g1_i1:129-782(-)
MTRPASVSFIFFLMLALLGMFQAYMCFPIPENADSMSMAFMKIFRLTLLGDFDTWELEGVDPVVRGKLDAKKEMVASMDDGNPSKRYHIGILIFVMVGAVTVTILSMNVAIGVLSSLYEEAKGKSLQIQSHYKVGYIFKLQLHKRFFGCCWPECRVEEDKEAQRLCCVLQQDIPSDSSSDGGGNQMQKEFESLKEELKEVKAALRELVKASQKANED